MKGDEIGLGQGFVQPVHGKDLVDALRPLARFAHAQDAKAKGLGLAGGLLADMAEPDDQQGLPGEGPEGDAAPQLLLLLAEVAMKLAVHQHQRRDHEFGQELMQDPGRVGKGQPLTVPGGQMLHAGAADMGPFDAHTVQQGPVGRAGQGRAFVGQNHVRLQPLQMFCYRRGRGAGLDGHGRKAGPQIVEIEVGPVVQDEQPGIGLRAVLRGHGVSFLPLDLLRLLKAPARCGRVGRQVRLR